MANAEIVIDGTGSVVANLWTTLEPESPLPQAGPIIMPLSTLLADPDHALALAGGIGVLVAPDDTLDHLARFLPRVALVAIAFPKFRDGRGFSHIRALREHLGWTGEIRATGHVLPDQFLSLVRCGVSTVALPEGGDPAVWAGVLALRGGLDPRPAAAQPLPLLRRLAVMFEV